MNNKLAWGVLLAVGATGAVTYQQGRWHLPGSAAASQSEDESSLALDGAKPHTVRLTDGADLPGIGVTTAEIFDRHGFIGTSAQTLLVQRAL